MRGKRFFKDDVQVIAMQRVPDGYGGTEMKEVVVAAYKVFIDTPTSQERFYTNQMNAEVFDRYMYYPYGLTIQRAMRLQTVEQGTTVTYEVIGQPEDQGNQNRIMRAKLREVKVT